MTFAHATLLSTTHQFKTAKMLVISLSQVQKFNFNLQIIKTLLVYWSFLEPRAASVPDISVKEINPILNYKASRLIF